MMTDAAEDKARKTLKEAANAAELTSSPALNDDALTETDCEGEGDQHMPKGNRLEP